MIDKDLLMNKVNSIQNCLIRIRGKFKKESFDIYELDTQDIVILNLQRAIQLTLDIAAHVVAAEKYGIPSTLKENFIILERNGWIEPKLAEKLGKMVGFRNIAVHDYQIIDPKILVKICEEHLTELEDFYTAILERKI